MNKQTLNERFEDYNEPTEQEEIWSDEIIGEEELQKKKNAITTFLTRLVQSSLFLSIQPILQPNIPHDLHKDHLPDDDD